MPTLRSQSKRNPDVHLNDGIPVYGHMRRLRVDTQALAPEENNIDSPSKRQKLLSKNEAILGPSILCSTPDNVSRPMLARAISNPTLDAEQWLTASVMNLILTRIAEKRRQIAYFSEQFSYLKLSIDDFAVLEDIIGRKLDILKTSVDQFVWLVNNGNVHWCLVRAILRPQRQLQLFDPLGNLSRRKAPNNRQIPRNIINWLNASFPFPDGASWQSCAIHAVTESHQQNSFDCGVACLLYAEKCGDSQTKEAIDAGTTQGEITNYRKQIQLIVQEVTSSLTQEPSSHTTDASCGSSSSSTGHTHDSTNSEQSPLGYHVS